MGRLLVFGLIAVAAWYGWKHYPDVMKKVPMHQAVIENASNETIKAVRLTVGGQTLVREELAPGMSATLPFKIDRDSNFGMIWMWTSRPGETQWSGGRVTAGPILSRHTFVIGKDGGVVHHSQNLSNPS